MLLPQLERLLTELREQKYNEKTIENIDKILADMKDIICKDDEAEQKEIELLYDDILKTLGTISREEQITEQQLSDILCVESFWQYRDQIKEKNGSQIARKVTQQEYIKKVLEGSYEVGVREKHKKIEIFDVINVCKGFFDVREFYYLEKEFESDIKDIFSEYSSGIKEIHYFYKMYTDEEMADQEDDDRKDNSLKNYYEKLYSKIILAIRQYHGINFEKQHEWKINLEDMRKGEKNFLTLCLKVVKGKSLSGIVEKIKIEDSVSNNYAYMLRQKGLKKICFIDTCGLDHIERGLGIKRHLNQMFTEYRDNKVDFDAIFYIKKLDAGKPTELQRIFPLLYNACPGKPIFCIFTGADIFYGGREELLIEKEWSSYNYELSKKLDENIIPKSAVFFYESQEIVEQMPCSEEWRKIIYHVVIENLVPFVADTQIRNKSEYIISNRRYLKKLFEAIQLDEWNIGYIDIAKINDQIEKLEFTNALKEDIKSMFIRASLLDWNRKHHMTVNANINRLLEKNPENSNSMGYNGVSEDRWDCLLKIGYQEVFLEGNSKVVKILSDYQIGASNLESMFAKLKDIIIAVDMRYKIVNSSEEKTKFRKSFELMYDEGSGHKYNPFSEEITKIQLNGQAEKREYLADVCDFTKGIDRDYVIQPFIEIFQDEIMTYIKGQNKKRMELLLQYQSDFKEKIYGVIDQIERVVGKENDQWILEMLKEVIKMRKKL